MRLRIERKGKATMKRRKGKNASVASLLWDLSIPDQPNLQNLGRGEGNMIRAFSRKATADAYGAVCWFGLTIRSQSVFLRARLSDLCFKDTSIRVDLLFIDLKRSSIPTKAGEESPLGARGRCMKGNNLYIGE